MASVSLLVFTLINFEIRTSELLNQVRSQLAANPFSKLAEVAVNSVQLQWGWAVLMLGALLIIGAAALPEHKDSPAQDQTTSVAAPWIALCVTMAIIIIGFVSFIYPAYQQSTSNSEVQETTVPPAVESTNHLPKQRGMFPAIQDNRQDSVTPIDATPAIPKRWTRTNSWSGRGMKQTETFYIPEREWRVQWRTSNELFKNAGILQIFVYTTNGKLAELCANRQGEGQDVSYVRGDPGEFYLEINSANVSWNITIERFIPFKNTNVNKLADDHEALADNSASAVPSDIQQLLNEWVDATVARDAARIANCYLPVVDKYFSKSNVTQEFVKADKDVMCRRYTEISRYQLSNLRVQSVDPNMALVSFNKTWDVRGVDRFVGSEREQLTLRMDGTSWKIASERELQIFEAAHTKYRQ